MKRVLLMTVAGLLMASSAMAGMENARFALHRKALFVPTTKITQLCPSTTSALSVPNYSPNWGSTSTVANPLACTGYSVSNGTIDAYSTVYVVVGRAGPEGIVAASFGIDYEPLPPALNGASWTKCVDGLEFPNGGPRGAPFEFPAPGGGIRCTWSNCQNQVIGTAGVHAVVGALTIYGYDGMVVSLTPNNNLASGAELAVANCANVETNLLAVWPPAIIPQILGKVGFGTSGVGYNPCLVTPVAAATWGKVKTLYNN